MPNRAWSDVSKGYRYGFNTQEKDNEIAGEGNSYTAEFWQYDGRLGRRFNLDPIECDNYSNYHVFFCNPLIFSDENGDWAEVKVTRYRKDGENKLEKKWWQFWYKTIEYVKDVRVHDVYIVNKTSRASDDPVNIAKMNKHKNTIKGGIEHWSETKSKTKYKRGKWGKILRDEEGDAETKEVKKFTINTTVVGDINVIEPSDLTKTNKEHRGRNQAEYFYIYNDETLKSELNTNTSNTILGQNRTNIMESQIDGSDPNMIGEYVIAHEWGHRGGIYHAFWFDLMTTKTHHTMESKGNLNYREIRKIFRTYFPTYRGRKWID